MKLKPAGILAIFLGAFFSANLVAFAQLSVAITVKNPDPYTGNQSWFVYQKQSGETIDDIASIKNYGSKPATIHICAVDGTTNTSGAFILKFDSQQQSGIGSWISIDKDEVTLKPGERVDVPFKINIPKNLQPGQYMGGLVVESPEAHMAHVTQQLSSNTQQESKPDTSYGQATVATRVGARIYLTIPGETVEYVKVESLQYEQPISSPAYFKFKIVNSGNVSYNPSATIEIYDTLGKLYDKIEKDLGTIAPHSTTEPIVMWNKRPFIGAFTANAQVTFQKEFQANGLHGAPLLEVASVKFNIFPWAGMIYSSLLVFIFIGLIIYQLRYHHQLYATAQKYQVAAREDLLKIADDHHVNWKQLARINKIKPPYRLNEGQNILIPRAKKTPTPTNDQTKQQ